MNNAKFKMQNANKAKGKRRGPELVCIGEAFDDLIFYDLPRLPRLGEELKTSRFAHVAGGGAITTAVTAARLGVTTRVVSAVSDLVRAHLRRHRVEVRDLRRRDELPALTAALSTRADRTFVTFNGVNDALEPRLRREVARITTARATAPRHVHCAFYTPRCRQWIAIVHRLQRRGRTVSWDFGWDPRLNMDAAFPRLLAQLDVAFVNEKEALLYSGRRTMMAALAWWRETVPTTVVKLGRRGAISVTRDGTIRARTTPRRAVESTGAGDAFNGGYLAAYVGRQDERTCLEAGNRAGGRAVRRAGGS